MTTYGPKIAHQGGPDCPCNPEAAGRVWQSARVLYQFEKMKDADWSDVLVYQLAEEPVWETVERECFAYLGAYNYPVFCHNEYEQNILSGGKIKNVPVRVTTNLKDGLPVSGSWEADA